MDDSAKILYIRRNNSIKVGKVSVEDVSMQHNKCLRNTILP